jgi:tRNA1(Val) A37 N6-methylase TrmN6
LGADAGLTQDAFLGGRLNIWQPANGYRAGVDPVFLAAAVPALPGQSVLELGCGVGVASLCLQHRVGGLDLTGLELQPDYADLARRNAAENRLSFRVICGDLGAMPGELRALTFDHVIANPPYFDRATGTRAQDTGRETAVGEGAPLARWIDAGVRRLAPKGHLTLIQKAGRLRDILSAVDGRLGDLRVLPLAPRDGRDAELVIVRARTGARGGLRLLAPVILHDGDRHVRDGESYRDPIGAILRTGAEFRVDWR